MEYYRIELHANGKKETSGFNGFDSANAFFSTEAKPTTPEFVRTMMKAINRTWNQEKRYWLDYAVGHLFIQDGFREADPMSPEWDYHKGSSFVKWKKVRS